MNTQTYAGRLTARFYPRLSELFGGCLYSQAPAEVPFEVFQEFYVRKLNSG